MWGPLAFIESFKGDIEKARYQIDKGKCKMHIEHPFTNCEH